jgi:urease gamma subunit
LLLSSGSTYSLICPLGFAQDKLILANLGFLAQKRLARGLKLNRSEATALIAFQLQEYVRDGKHSVADLMQLGKEFLGRRHVLEGVEEAIHDVQIEGTFPVCADKGKHLNHQHRKLTL